MNWAIAWHISNRNMAKIRSHESSWNHLRKFWMACETLANIMEKLQVEVSKKFLKKNVFIYLKHTRDFVFRFFEEISSGFMTKQTWQCVSYRRGISGKIDKEEPLGNLGKSKEKTMHKSLVKFLEPSPWRTPGDITREITGWNTTGIPEVIPWVIYVNLQRFFLKESLTTLDALLEEFLKKNMV